ncbi:Uncharacterized protein Rs2_04983 [Raphanus sativus]|nr:Uncharacterized protein Rs2_04983 [Raphanus sativus]
MELTEGRMLIEVDTRKPLKFSRKVEYEGDEVTIEIKYEYLFKHCTLCGMLTHEKGYCPTTDIKNRIQIPETRPGVFSRVQDPYAMSGSLNLGRQTNADVSSHHQPSRALTETRFGSQVARDTMERQPRVEEHERRSSNHRSWENNRHWGDIPTG